MAMLRRTIIHAATVALNYDSISTQVPSVSRQVSL